MKEKSKWSIERKAIFSCSFIFFKRLLQYGGHFFVELLDTQFKWWGSHCHRNVIIYLFEEGAHLDYLHIAITHFWAYFEHFPIGGKCLHNLNARTVEKKMMMMMMMMMMTLITCQMTSSRGGIATPPLSPLIKGHLKIIPTHAIYWKCYLKSIKTTQTNDT